MFAGSCWPPVSRAVVAIGLWAIVAGPERLAAQASPALVAPLSIRVDGDVPHPYTLRDVDLRTMPRQSITASEHEGPPARFEGIPLTDILIRAGAEFGAALRGERLAAYVLVEAYDGYRVVFAIAELDPAFSNKVVILADRMNGAPLPAAAGPARIVVSDEARAARWIRQVTRIRLLAAPPPAEEDGA